MKLSLGQLMVTTPLLLGLVSPPGNAQLLEENTQVEDFLSAKVGSNYKKQTVRYDHNGGYVSDPVITTKCVHAYSYEVYGAKSGLSYAMAAPQERDFTSVVSKGDWQCASSMEVSAAWGSSNHYALRRCENVTVTSKGGSSNPKADVTYQNCSEKGVTFYEHCNHSGRSRVIGAGNFKLGGLEALGIDNDYVSSVKIPLGYEVDLFEHNNFGGRKLTLQSGSACLTEHNFNDKITSAKIRVLGPAVFQHCDYDGYGVALAPGSYTSAELRQQGVRTADLSSIKVPPGFEIELFELDGFHGKSIILTDDHSCLVDQHFNDKTLSLIVRNKTDSAPSQWSFDESVGVVAVDRGSNSLHGMLFGAAAFTGSTANTGSDNPSALSFDGVNAYVRIPDADTIDFGPDDDFTVAVWIKAETNQLYTLTGDNDVVEKWAGSGGYPFVIRYNNQTTGAKSGKIQVGRYDGSNNPTIRSTRTIDDGHFHHVAFVKQNDTLRLYIDGVEDGTATDSTTADTSNSSPLYLGRRGEQNRPNWFTGAIDDLRIYNSALSDDQVAELAQFATSSF